MTMRRWLQERPLWIRLLVVLAHLLTVAGLAAVCWHWVGGKSWDDSLSFALTVMMSGLGALCGTAIVRRKAGRGDN
ncbi:hypothetical protein [Streptomyces bauhiniae]|uniref:hypothetical protein n=1 Tax=Streptomyces bauhiniae TaxID=2340725 RepID=UPI00365E2DA5